MNEKITLPTLVSLLAEKTGKQKKQCEDFLREFFNTLVDALSEGENVRVKGLGTFKIVSVEARKSVNVNTGEQMEIPSHRKIVFVPAKELAEEVNAPFAMFESIELPENAEEKEVAIESEAELPIETGIEDIETELDEPEESDNLKNDNTNDNIEEIEEIEIKEIAQTEEIEREEEIVSTEQEVTVENTPAISENIVEEETEEAVDIIEQKGEKQSKNYRFLFGFACGVACTALICLCMYMLFPEKFKIQESPEKETSPTTTAVTENIDVKPEVALPVAPVDDSTAVPETEEVPTRPSDEAVYDTITKTRYLTTMAKEHYGNYNLWPYIYEENKAMLGHPDRIRPGTRVVVPSLSKYNVDPKNPEDIKKAKSKGIEIYSRYK